MMSTLPAARTTTPDTHTHTHNSQVTTRVPTIRMHLLSHEREDGLGVLKRLRSAGCTRILAVVSQLLATTEVTDGVTEEGRRRLSKEEGRQWVGGSELRESVAQHIQALSKHDYGIGTHLYITEAPPPATMVQIRPFGFSTVSFREAPLFASKSAI